MFETARQPALDTEQPGGTDRSHWDCRGVPPWAPPLRARVVFCEPRGRPRRDAPTISSQPVHGNLWKQKSLLRYAWGHDYYMKAHRVATGDRIT